MDRHNNIYVAGNFIAEQHIESQFIGGTHTHVQQIVREIRPMTVEADEAVCSQKEQAQVEAVEAELRSAANGSAAKLVAAIRTNEALEYLDTKNMSSQALYDALNAYFGLKYSARKETWRICIRRKKVSLPSCLINDQIAQNRAFRLAVSLSMGERCFGMGGWSEP